MSRVELLELGDLLLVLGVDRVQLLVDRVQLLVRALQLLVATRPAPRWSPASPRSRSRAPRSSPAASRACTAARSRACAIRSRDACRTAACAGVMSLGSAGSMRRRPSSRNVTRTLCDAGARVGQRLRASACSASSPSGRRDTRTPRVRHRAAILETRAAWRRRPPRAARRRAARARCCVGRRGRSCSSFSAPPKLSTSVPFSSIRSAGRHELVEQLVVRREHQRIDRRRARQIERRQRPPRRRAHDRQPYLASRCTSRRLR